MTSFLLTPFAFAREGEANVYVNDYGTDEDGDGLGLYLEEQLGTCDRRTIGVDYPPYCADTARTPLLVDSDRDGLADAIEVFGKEDPTNKYNAQYMPRWGANPLHKDVFIEVDWSADLSLPRSPVTGDDALAAENYMQATGDEMNNLDGEGGPSIHLDIGRNSKKGTLYGDWGGSTEVPGLDSEVNLNTVVGANMSAVRFGLFRWGVLFNAATDNPNAHAQDVPGFTFGWPGTAADRDMGAFVHELGHTMGLDHWGTSTDASGVSYGALNCKPNYPSLMNYVGPGQFSHGANVDGSASVILDPSALSELSTFGTSKPTFDPVFGLTTNAAPDGTWRIDWNRDGLFDDSSSGAVKASVTMERAHDDDCTPHDRNATDLRNWTAAILTTPRLVKIGDYVVALYADIDGGIKYRTARVDPSSFTQGSCPRYERPG